MLELASFTVTDPRGNTLLGPLDLGLAPGTVTGLVGRTGSGTNTLLEALMGTLPQGIRTSGRLRVGNLNARRASPDELSSVVRVVTPDRPIAGSVADFVGHRRSTEGLAPWLDHPVVSVPPAIRAQLCLLELQRSTTPVVVLSQVLTPAAPSVRTELVRTAMALAAGGTTVLWADHALDPLWAAADRMCEISGGAVVSSTPSDEWRPVSVPEPVCMAVARLAGLDQDHLRTPDELAKVLSSSPLRRHQGAPASPRTGTTLSCNPIELGLQAGPNLEFHQQETVGVLRLDGRAEEVAAALTKALGGDHLPSRLPVGVPVRSVIRAWERRRQVARGSVQYDGANPGAVRLALSAAGGAPLWLPHPELGLDPVARNHLLAQLRGPQPGLRIITSQDPDVLAASHRLLVVKDGSVVALRATHAALPLMPHRPAAARATGLDITRLEDLDPASVLEVLG